MYSTFSTHKMIKISLKNGNVVSIEWLKAKSI